MTTLLEQIRDGAVDSHTDLGDVLRKALILAHQLEQRPEKEKIHLRDPGPFAVSAPLEHLVRAS